MSKTKQQFKCSDCEFILSKWSGQCPNCKEWDKVVEHTKTPTLKISNFSKTTFEDSTEEVIIQTLNDQASDVAKIKTDIDNIDQILGGGIVPGSVILIGGDPGVGKSTILLQILDKLSKKLNPVYFSGEESLSQIKLRAKRLGIENDKIKISNNVEVSAIASYLRKNEDINLAVIDSIQTTYVKELGSFPGNANQLRSSTLEFTDLAKSLNIVFILIGHITKDGHIAGPKLLEHMVDTVLYFEGEKNSNLRILRSYKNRFGSTNELAIFDMKKSGLEPIYNTSQIFLEDHNFDVPGSAIFPLREGSHTIFLELQALISKSYMATPKRAVVGWDANRLSIILAVLNSRANLDLGQYEVYFNVIGGIKITEPAADLAAAAAIISAAKNKPLPGKTIIIGELGLSGEVRSVTNLEERLTEAKKLGYTNAIIPKSKKNKSLENIIHLKEIQHITELKDLI
jgi:DNA repair protein RadA/Sms